MAGKKTSAEFCNISNMLTETAGRGWEMDMETEMEFMCLKLPSSCFSSGHEGRWSTL
jgi:hypothetical protein